MKVYIDDNFICHLENDGTYTSYDVPFFDDKAPLFIENHRYIPSGQVYIRNDLVAFQGESIFPVIDAPQLEIIQLEYEKQQLLNFIGKYFTIWKRKPYPVMEKVFHNNKIWLNTINDNETEPGVSDTWIEFEEV